MLCLTLRFIDSRNWVKMAAVYTVHTSSIRISNCLYFFKGTLKSYRSIGVYNWLYSTKQSNAGGGQTTLNLCICSWSARLGLWACESTSCAILLPIHGVDSHAHKTRSVGSHAHRAHGVGAYTHRAYRNMALAHIPIGQIYMALAHKLIWHVTHGVGSHIHRAHDVGSHTHRAHDVGLHAPIGHMVLAHMPIEHTCMALAHILIGHMTLLIYP